MKKLFALLLVLSMSMTLLAVPALGEEPLTIEFWHAGSGSVGTTIDAAGTLIFSIFSSTKLWRQAEHLR